MEVIKARYSGCNEGKEVVRVKFDRKVGEDNTVEQTGILVKATEKSLVVCEESKRRPGDKELSPECPLCSEETELQSSTTPCSQNKFRRI
jgi:hypothetical protein